MQRILGGKKGVVSGCAVILLLSVLSYLPCLDGTWLVDDGNYVVDNVLLRDGAGLRTIWTDLKASKQYYPLVFTSLWFDYQVWGLNPLGYHLVNLLLHFLNSLLIWRLLRFLGLKGAWMAAAVFAVHPAHVESVAWIAERKNVLSTFFYFVALYYYLRFAGGRGPDGLGPSARVRHQRGLYYTLAVTAFVLALLSKTSTATLPGAVLVILWWKRGRIGTFEVRPLLPLVGLGTLLGLVTIWLERTNVGATGGIFDISFAQRIQVAGTAVWHYVITVFWPFALSFDYGRWNPDPANLRMWLGPVGVVAVLVALWGLRNRWGRGPMAAVLFFLGTVFPALGFFNLYFFRYSYVADHFLYPASLGLICLAFGLISQRTWSRGMVAAGWTVSLFLLLGLTAMSSRQAGNFSDMSSLCHSILVRNPDSWLAHNNLGDQMMKEGRLADALKHLLQAEGIAPDRLETQMNLAIVRMNRQEFPAALNHAQRAVSLSPEVKFAHNLLGEVHQRMGDAAAAEADFTQALALDEGYSRARANLGSLMAEQGRYAQAMGHLERAVREDPGLVAARSNLGITLVNLGDYEGAVEQFEAALASQPENMALKRNLELARSMAAGEGQN